MPRTTLFLIAFWVSLTVLFRGVDGQEGSVYLVGQARASQIRGAAPGDCQYAEITHPCNTSYNCYKKSQSECSKKCDHCDGASGANTQCKLMAGGVLVYYTCSDVDIGPCGNNLVGGSCQWEVGEDGSSCECNGASPISQNCRRYDAKGQSQGCNPVNPP